MVDYPDQPDYHEAVIPGVVRWAPGTQFGSVVWDGSVAANATQNVVYAFPDNGYYYVLDKSNIWTYAVGRCNFAIDVCSDNSAPSWVGLTSCMAECVGDLLPFTFVSMTLSYPQALRWRVTNPDNVARYVWVYANLYRYLSS